MYGVAPGFTTGKITFLLKGHVGMLVIVNNFYLR